jgi:Tfp pilus assembly protein PilX
MQNPGFALIIIIVILLWRLLTVVALHRTLSGHREVIEDV